MLLRSCTRNTGPNMIYLTIDDLSPLYDLLLNMAGTSASGVLLAS